MPHNHEYKMLSYYCAESIPTNGGVAVEELLADFGDTIPDRISDLPDKLEWEIISHSIAFVNNHPVASLLLRHI